MRRMDLTFVPTLMGVDEPFTFKSLITVTLSPSARTLPTASLMTGKSSVASSARHSWLHMGQIKRSLSA